MAAKSDHIVKLDLAAPDIQAQLNKMVAGCLMAAMASLPNICQMVRQNSA